MFEPFVRITADQSLWFYLLIFIFSGICLIRVFSANYYSLSLSVLPNPRLTQQHLREGDLSKFLPSLINFLIIGVVIFWFMTLSFEGLTPLLITFGILFWFVFVRVLGYFIAWITDLLELYKMQMYYSSTFWWMSMVLILPVIVFQTFYPFDETVFQYIILSIFLCVHLIKITMQLYVSQSLIKEYFLNYFIYLCSLEIMPVILILRFFSHN